MWVMLRLEAGNAEIAQTAEPTSGLAHLRGGHLLGRADRLVHGGLHHVLKKLDVLGVDRFRVDLQLQQLEVAAHLDGDHAAAGTGLDGGALQLLLRLGHLGLHLLDLLHHLVEVGLLGHDQVPSSSSTTSVAPNSERSRSSSSSSLSRAGPWAAAALSS